MKEARRRKYVLEHLYLSQYHFLTLLTFHQNQTKHVPIKGIVYVLFTSEVVLNTPLGFFLIKGEALVI